MKSAEAKAAMLWHALYRLHFLIAVTEYGGMGCEGVADVFCIANSDFTHEFEVKVSKADLMGELTAIQYHMTQRIPVKEEPWFGTMSFIGNRPDNTKATEPPPRQARKGSKHWWYLIHTGEMHWRAKPNRFSFVVPEGLVADAKPLLKGTPYGLYVVNKHHSVECIVKAGYIHREKAHNEIIRRVAHKTSTEIQSLRAHLAAVKLEEQEEMRGITAGKIDASTITAAHTPADKVV